MSATLWYYNVGDSRNDACDGRLKAFLHIVGQKAGHFQNWVGHFWTILDFWGVSFDNF